MSRSDVLFVDIGGVCLTNGWDTGSRRDAAARFALDFEEMERRHQNLVERLERGEMSLSDYLERVVFHVERAFSRETFLAFMEAQSQPHGAVLDLLRRIAAETSYVLATINNESRELNRYRIATFRLSDIFTAFFSSCYLGIRKPDAEIYHIAIDVLQADRRTSVFVDDREENVTGAREAGLHAIHVTDRARLAEQLRDVGIKIATRNTLP